MQWKKITAPAGFAIAAAFLFMAPAHAADQYDAKFDVVTPAHFDTTFSSAPSDTVLFGFAADNVSVCVPATSSAVVTWFGGIQATNSYRQPLLLSNSGGRTVNPRKGLARFVSNAFTPPASSCYTYYGPPICRGVIITGTWTGTVNLSADRVAK